MVKKWHKLTLFDLLKKIANVTLSKKYAQKYFFLKSKNVQLKNNESRKLVCFWISKKMFFILLFGKCNINILTKSRIWRNNLGYTPIGAKKYWDTKSLGPPSSSWGGLGGSLGPHGLLGCSGGLWPLFHSIIGKSQKLPSRLQFS